mmetsp:Transcript_29334/g.73652  ORF Transcript_29334/g.73652 Transcript_29334/m.73652 type:complete len:201 (-) Transcript_29334:273-875(-)
MPELISSGRAQMSSGRHELILLAERRLAGLDKVDDAGAHIVEASDDEELFARDLKLDTGLIDDLAHLHLRVGDHRLAVARGFVLDAVQNVHAVVERLAYTDQHLGQHGRLGGHEGLRHCCLDGAAALVAHHDHKLDAEHMHGEVDTASDRIVGQVTSVAAHEDIADPQVEDDFDGHARVGAANDHDPRGLAGDELAALDH